MYLPSFEYHRPRRIDEALALREEMPEAAWYVGGTELLALMKLDLASPPALIDLKAITELRRLEVGADAIRIGATVTHRTLERDPRIRDVLSVLSEVEHDVGNVRVRNVGSLGGNLCFAEPHSDPAALLLALDATVDLMSSRGSRSLGLGEFLLGPFETALQPDEVLHTITIPRPERVVATARGRRAFRERPTVNVIVARLDDGHRVAVGAAGPLPVRAPEAERMLDGCDKDPTALREVAAAAGEHAGEACRAYDEAGASTEYKQHLVAVLVRRAIEELADRGQ